MPGPVPPDPEIRQYDGSTISVPVDIIPGSGGTGPGNLISYGSAPNALYFAGNTEYIGNREVLRLDGSTFKVAADINHTTGGFHPSSSFPEDFTELGAYLYFSADDGIHGRELWRLKSQRFLKVFAQIGRLFDPFWEWPIDPLQPVDREIIVALVAMARRGDPVLVGRLSLPESKMLDDRHEKSFDLDMDALKLPDQFGLVMLGFDAKSGRALGYDTGLVGERSDASDRSIRARADKFARGLTLDELEKMGKRRKGGRQ